MDENQRAEFARLEAARERYCPNCSGRSPTGGLCPTCMITLSASESTPVYQPWAEGATCGGCGHFRAVCSCASEADPQDDRLFSSSAPVDDADLRDYMTAYESSFSATDQLNRLWAAAAQDRGYEAARSAFWGMVNQGAGDDAAYVRAMLETAGYRLGTGTEAPMLDMDWDDERSGRLDAARRLSIDHATPQSKDPSLATDPSNLRFMLSDDNSRRGARWNADDRRYSDVCPGCWAGSPGGARCQNCVKAESPPDYVPDR